MKKHGRDTAQAADQTADQAAASPRHKKARLADDIQTAANADNNSAPAAAAAGDLIPVMCGDARGQYSSSKGQVLVESAQDKGSWVSRADFVNRLGGRGSHDYFKAIKVVAPDGSSSGQLGKYLKQHPQGKKQQPKKKPAAAAAAQEEAEAEEQEGSDAAAAAPAEAEAPKSAKRGSAKSGAGASGGSRGNRKSTAAAAADIAAAPPSAAKSAGKARGGRKSAAAAAADTDAAGDGDHDATDAAAAAGSGGNTSPKRTQRSVATKTHQTGKPAAANGRRSKGQSAAAAAAEHEEVAGTTDDVIITDADDGTKAAADDAAAAAVAAADVEEGKNASQQQEQKPKLRKQKKGPAAGKLQGKQPVAAAAAAAAAAEAEPESAAAEAEPESAAAEAEPESAAAGAADAAATQEEANVIVPAGATSPQLGGEGGGEGAAAPPLNPPLDSLTVDEVFTAAAAAHADTEDQDLGPLINGPDMGQAVGQVGAAGQGGPGADRDEVANEDQWVAGMQYEWQLGAASAAAEPVNDAVPAAAVTQVVPGTPTTEHPAQEHDAAAELAAAAAAVVGDALQQRGPAGAAADTEGKQQQEEAGQMDSDGRNETDTAAAPTAAPTAQAAAAAAAAAETEVKAETVPQQQQEEEVAQAGSNRKPAAMEGVEGLGEAGDAAAVAVPAGHPVAVSAAARAAAAAPAVAVPPVAVGDAGPSFAQLRAVLPHSEGLDCCWAIAKQVHGTAVNPAGIQVAPILRTYADVATLDDCRQSFRSAAPAQRQQTLERLAALLQLLGEPVVGRNGALRIVGAEEMYDGIQSALADCQKIWESDSSE